ncbi:MAG TPA: DnaJ domain-containing protein [Acidimicrobiales bacterium]|nr:DnaJ domain-containing protein [Acidimicrobiales bacterium]
MTHYEVLGIDDRAPAAEVRRAYVRLARRHHPDFFSRADAPTRAEAERCMRAINEAWEVLGDPARRMAYDRAQGIAAEADGDARPFEPFDAGEEDVDPRDLPDEPYRDERGRDGRLGRGATLAPVVAFAASVVLAAIGMVVGSVGLLALALISFLAACLGFVVIPLVALSRASRND